MNLPYFLIYIKESYENMNMLFPEEYGTDRYRVFGGRVVPVTKYKTVNKERERWNCLIITYM